MDYLDAVTMLTTTWFDNILLKSLMDLEGYVVIVQCGRGLMQTKIFDAKHVVNILRSVTACLLKEIDPEGSINRQAHRLRRRHCSRRTSRTR